MNYGTFNTIAQRSVAIGSDFPVWARVEDVFVGGGTIDVSDYNAGDVIKAGTMVIYAGAGKPVTVVAASDSDNLKKVNGLIWNDVCIPEGAVMATCAVVRKGRIYADRAGIPASVEAQLPMIEFVRES
jgi:hypothetical protein